MNDIDDATDLRRLMETALTDLHPDATRLGTTARTRGRLVRQRRRALTGIATLGAAAVVGAVATATLGGASTVGSGFAGDPSPTTGPTGSSSTAVTADPTPVDPSNGPDVTRSATAEANFPSSLGTVDLPARQMLRRLRPLLPEDVTITRADVVNTDIAPGDDPRRVGNLLVGLDRPGHVRRGGLEIMLYAAPGGSSGAADAGVARATSCPPTDRFEVEVTQCDELTDPAGAPIGRALASIDGDFVIREVLREAADGSWVYVADANSLDQKWGAGYTALDGLPPLSLAELAEIAADPTWTTS